jgi:hypothetical protein
LSLTIVKISLKILIWEKINKKLKKINKVLIFSIVFLFKILHMYLLCVSI